MDEWKRLSKSQEEAHLREKETVAAPHESGESDAAAPYSSSSDLSHQPSIKAAGALSDSEQSTSDEHLTNCSVDDKNQDKATSARVQAQPLLNLFVPRFDLAGPDLGRIPMPRATVALNKNLADNYISDGWTDQANASHYFREPWTGATKFEATPETIVSPCVTDSDVSWCTGWGW